MFEVAAFRDWAEYNIRAREGYLAVLEKLSKEELARDRGASYPSLLQIQSHILGAQWWWLKNASLPPGPAEPTDFPDPPSLEDIQRFEGEVDAAVRVYFLHLSEEDLDRKYPAPTPAGYSQDIEITVRDTLLHLLEEEIQHRGELNALLWQLDVEPPVLDWIDWKYILRPQSGR
ncbi:MAG: DinB family protein [Thermoplasmata archaeon]|nr:DinB family protein [Thermoplasmata archaeon]